jgi:TonB family protein
MSMAVLVAAPKAAAAIDITPLVSSSDWRLRMAERIDSNKTFPAEGYCQEGVVRISFMIDRAGNLLSSGIAESSNVTAFDVEALAILKRAHPFPRPPEGFGGPFMSLTVPIHFKQHAPGATSDKRLYLHLKSDMTLTLNGVPIPSERLDREISSTASNDKSAWVLVCSDENVPPEQLSKLAERVKATGFQFTLVPRSTPEAD